jgi:hypothetical protein
MHSTDIPAKLPIPFGNAASGGYIRSIPVASQIGVTDGAASLTDGFVPLNATPIGAGGVPPDIKDMNGILFEVSGWARWQSAGGPVFFDGAFAALIGGYPKGGVVQSATTPGVFYVSTADSNSTDPEGVGAANWTLVVPAPASNAETAAGALTTKFVTPAGLASLRALSADIIAGTSPSLFMTPTAFYGARATPSDVQAGTDDHKYLTAYGLLQGLTADANHIILPGGLMLQWGKDRTVTNTTGVAHTVTYPHAFSASPYAVLYARYDNIGGAYNQKHIIMTDDTGTTGFTWQIQDDDTGSSGSYIRGFDWAAIGPA